MRLSAQRIEQLSVIKINEKKIEHFKSLHQLTGKAPVRNLQDVLVEIDSDGSEDQPAEDGILSLFPRDEIGLFDEEEDFLENLTEDEG